MRFEIREYTAATKSVRGGEVSRRTGKMIGGEEFRSLGEEFATLATLDAPHPQAAIADAKKFVANLGFNAANYVDTDEPTCCTWFVTDSRLLALMVAS